MVRKEREKGSLTKELQKERRSPKASQKTQKESTRKDKARTKAKQMRDPRARAKVIDSAMFVDVLVTWQRAVGRTRSR